MRALDERDEAEWVDRRTCSCGVRQKGMPLRDVAILYRTNAQSRALEEALRRHAIPYRLVGAVRFYDRREIRDLMAYLRLVANPADDEAFRRAIGAAAPRPRRHDRRVARRSGRASTGVPCSAAASRPDILADLRPAARGARRLRRADREVRARDIDDVRGRRAAARARRSTSTTPSICAPKATEAARERLENVRELINGAAETVADEGGEVGAHAARPFLQRRRCRRRRRARVPNADAVTLMTMHNAKGLEFPHRVHHRSRGRPVPARARVRRSAAARGGAPALLRRHHARRADAVPHVRRGAPPQRRADAVAPVELPRRHPEGDARASASTIKVRSTGRAVLSSMFGGSRTPGGMPGSRCAGSFDDDAASSPAARRRAGNAGASAGVEPEDESQDAAALVIGRAGAGIASSAAGTIAELAGTGTRRQGEDRLRRRDDRSQDARRRAGEPRTGRGLTDGRHRWRTSGTSRRSRGSGSRRARRRIVARAEHDPRAHGRCWPQVDTRAVAEASEPSAARDRRCARITVRRRRSRDRPEAFAPSMRDGFFLVPRLATHEDAGSRMSPGAAAAAATIAADVASGARSAKDVVAHAISRAREAGEDRKLNIFLTLTDEARPGARGRDRRARDRTARGARCSACPSRRRTTSPR